MAAVPVIAGATIAVTDREKTTPVTATTTAPTASAPATAQPDPLPAEFAALVDHVRQRAALRREGAPINSLVLDNRQTVLNPVAIGCDRREPLVIIDADPAATAAENDAVTTVAWRHAVTEIRKEGVGILWITDRPDADMPALRAALAPSGLDPGDTIARRASAADRKQLVRQRWALTHCILAVVGDIRSDADEAYDYLRTPDATLPIDSNWGKGWFLLPAPRAAESTE